MAWTVEIHHIFLGGAGDSTLIVAHHPPAAGQPGITRTVLIDGGRSRTGAPVDNYVTGRFNCLAVDVIAVTHFDEDHYYGIVGLLKRPAPSYYQNTIIYDCGRLPDYRLVDVREDPRGRGLTINKDSMYKMYRDAIGARIHATGQVNSFHIVHYDAANRPVAPTPINAPATAGYLPPDWLLGKDIMWGNGQSAPGAWAETQFPHAPGQPTLRCITANKWVRQAGAPAQFISGVNIFDGGRMDDNLIARFESAKKLDNAKSLGFLLEFNEFKYYVAGDLDRIQEDGHLPGNGAPLVFQPGVKALVNQTNTAADRVLAMKTSHHGAITASSRDFLSRLRPSAAFISCGRRNKYGHPDNEVVNSLDGYPEVPVGATANKQHPLSPPPAPLPPIRHYLTGYQVDTAPVQTRGGVHSRTGGPPGDHIRLEVDEDQSRRDRRGQVYRGVLATATRTSAAANLGLAPAQLDSIADAAVMDGAIAACALAIGGTIAVANAAKSALAWAGDSVNVSGVAVFGVVSAAVDAATAPGGSAATAAAAAAAIGPGRAVAIGPGTAATIAAAVTGATAANITAAALAAAPGLAPAAATAAGFAAEIVRAHTTLIAAGFAAVAALKAGGEAATAAQATALATAMGALIGGADDTLTARLTTTAARAAGMADPMAAVAGAVVSAAAFRGVPASVLAASQAGLIAGNFAGVAGATAMAAANDATIAANDLFTVHFDKAPPGIPHTG